MKEDVINVEKTTINLAEYDADYLCSVAKKLQADGKEPTDVNIAEYIILHKEN